MSQVPDLCVDIFSNIASMLRSLNSLSNQQHSGSEFTHGSGFQPAQPSPLESAAPEQSNLSPEALIQWFIFGVLIFFLMFGQRQREPANDAKPINRAQDDSSNRDPDFDNDNDRSRMF